VKMPFISSPSINMRRVRALQHWCSTPNLVMLGRTLSQCLAAYGAAAMCDAVPVLMLLQELQIQLKHASAPAEQLLKQVRAAEQAAAAREARLEEHGRKQAELAARQATQALQALRAQLTAAHAEALLEVSCQPGHSQCARPPSVVPDASEGVLRDDWH